MANKHEFDVRGFSFVVLFCILVIAIMQTTFLSTAFVERWAYENARFQRSAQVLLTMPPQKIVPYNLTLGFVGDIMLDRGVKGAIENYGSGDCGSSTKKWKMRSYKYFKANLCRSGIAEKSTGRACKRDT